MTIRNPTPVCVLIALCTACQPHSQPMPMFSQTQPTCLWIPPAPAGDRPSVAATSLLAVLVVCSLVFGYVTVKTVVLLTEGRPAVEVRK